MAKSKQDGGIDLAGRAVSDDEAIRRVVDAEAKLAEARREIKALRTDRDQLLQEHQDLVNARPVSRSPIRKRAKTRDDTVRVSVGDVHGQLMDRQAVSAFLSDLKTLDPDEVILGGDIVECGGWLAKHQPIGFIALSDYSYQEDILAANWFLDEVQKAAPKATILYLEGNHEDRVERWVVDQTMAHGRDAEFLRQLVSPQALLRLDERGIEYFRRTEIYVSGLPRGWIKRGKMFFTHELGSGRNAASNAVDKTAGNVTYFHTHREDTSTRVFPGVGIVKAFCPGCLSSIQPVWRHSDPTNWSQGYGIDIIAKSGLFQRIQVPIWRGESLAPSMIQRFRKA